MNSMAYGISATPMLRRASGRARFLGRLVRVLTPSNVAAVIMCFALLSAMLITVVPYEIVNRSQVCRYCGGYEYSSQHTFGGICVRYDRLFAPNTASRLYDRLVSDTHKHEWLLAGECHGQGNIFDQSKLRIIRGAGAARSQQLEQSLMALAEIGDFSPHPDSAVVSDDPLAR